MSPAPCHVPTCPTRPGPSGFCRFHQNRLNARASAYAEYMTDADRIAIAAHPGWRGRAYRLVVVLSPNEEPRYTCVNVEATRRMWAQHMRVFDAADEALAELDRKNGVAPAADVARLGAEVGGLTLAVAVARAERDTARAYADAIRTHRDALEERRRELAADNDLLHLQVDTARWAHADLLVDIIGLRDELATLDADAKTLTAERRSARWALNDIRAIARGLLPAPTPPSASPATLEESALAVVATLIRDRDEIRRDRDTLAAALDKQAATVANLTSELAERERDITYACADRDEYMRERDEARADLTLARRPWWRKVWAWVTGGAE